MMNSLYNSNSTSSCEEPFVNMFGEIKDGLVITSIFSDLIAGAISSLFTYQMYHGVEISHPVYSVVFSNNILANILSFLTFLMVLVRYCTQCCICQHLFAVIWSFVLFMNGTCWIVVAFLRYHLLITTAKRNDMLYEETEMTKMTMIALIAYWGLLMLLSAIRSTLAFMARGTTPFTGSTIAIMTLLTILSMKLITVLVYYRLDAKLKAITCLTNTKDETDNKGVGGSEVIGSANKSPPKNLPGSFEMKDRPIKNSKKKSNETKHLPKQSSQQHSSCIPRLKCEMPISTSCTAEMPDNIQCADEKPYGGIYVGETSISDVVIHTSKMTSREREDEVHRSKVDDTKPPKDAQVAKSHSVFCSFHDSSLPNQVLRESKEGLDSFEIHGVCLKHHGRQEDINTKYNSPRTKDKDNDDDRIVVVQEWFEEESSEPKENTKNIEDGPEDKSELEVNTYQDSKEHRSIKKAIIVNLFSLALVCALNYSITFIIHTKRGKGNAILLVKTLFSLYRTLTPIISSIYCFDVIRCLYRQLLEIATDNLRNVYDIARGML